MGIKTKKSQNFILPWKPANLVFISLCWSLSREAWVAPPALREGGTGLSSSAQGGAGETNE